MKTTSRLISHCLLVLLLSLMPLLYYAVALFLGVNHGNPLFLGMVALILGLNIIYAWFTLKAALWKKVAFAVTAGSIGFLLSELLIRVGINVENDVWGIAAWLLGNAFFTIVVWEIIYQVTKNAVSPTAIVK